MAPVVCLFMMIAAYLTDSNKFRKVLDKQKIPLGLLIVNLSSFIMMNVLIVYQLNYFADYDENRFVFFVVHLLEIMTLITIPLLIYNPADLRDLIVENMSRPMKILLMLTFLYVGYVDRIISGYIGTMLIEPTINLAQFFYRFTGGEIRIDHYSEKGWAVITGGSFYGEVLPGCAGYEGLSFIVLFLIIFYPFLREAFNKVEFLLVISICLAAVFLMNSIRMAILMYIGEHVSPEVAVGGFHTNFGMLTLVIVSIICMVSVWIKNIFRADNKTVSIAESSVSKNLSDETYMILPLVVLLSTSLITGLANTKFNWLYPVPIIMATIACIPLRGKIKEYKYKPLYAPTLVGLGVFVFWIFLIPRDAKYEAEFIEDLNLYGEVVAAMWIIIRIAGSSFIVPLVEELAFRGALWDILIEKMNFDISLSVKKIITLLITSVAFGYLHEDIVAATLAGLCYGSLRFYYDSKSYPIWAHVVTNLLVAIYVIVFRAWTYW